MIAYFIVRFLRINSPELPTFIRFYLTDLLFIPTMGFFALIFVRILKRDVTIKITAPSLFIQVLLVSIYFEWYLPNYSSTSHWYTSDFIDVLMYVFGGFIFLWMQRKC